jgi:hypothetical protein
MVRITLFILLVLTSTQVFAVQNLGVHGKTYEIEENNFYEWLMSQIRAKQDNFEKFNKFTEQDVYKMLTKQMEVDGFDIPNCSENNTKTVNPTYILDHHIKDTSGNILYSKGTVVNPFNYISFKRKYFFLDVDNDTQVNLYREIVNKSDIPIQPLAVSGNLQEFFYKAKSMGLPIPAGKTNTQIIKKMNIRCVPSLAYQKGNLLEVKEFGIKGGNSEKD